VDNFCVNAGQVGSLGDVFKETFVNSCCGIMYMMNAIVVSQLPASVKTLMQLTSHVTGLLRQYLLLLMMARAKWAGYELKMALAVPVRWR